MKLVLVTGLSGAGKSVALRTLEDAGYEAIDNMPLSFLPAIVAASASDGRVAIGADTRSRDFSEARFTQALAALKAKSGLDVQLLFLECDDEALQRRFTETRRRHPLAQDRTVADGIARERQMLAGIRAQADVVVDTSIMPVADLRRVIGGHFAGQEEHLAVTVMSFSYRHGLPREADVVFDARFLRNPHYVEVLREHTGREAAVGEYIAADAGFEPFFNGMVEWLQPLLPRYAQEGKHYLTIAIGCTGGRHRSVYTAERLVERLRQDGMAVDIRHRELGDY